MVREAPAETFPEKRPNLVSIPASALRIRAAVMFTADEETSIGRREKVTSGLRCEEVD